MMTHAFENYEQFKEDDQNHANYAGINEDDVEWSEQQIMSEECMGYLHPPETFVCSECNMIFKYIRNLERHFLRVHPSSTFVEPDSVSKYPCKYCGETFNKLHLLKHHFRTKHQNLEKTVTHKCVLCGLSLKGSLHLKHLEEQHKIHINIENLHFTKFQEFLQWKVTMEKKTKSSYKKVREIFMVHGIKHHHYHCHRSGYSESKVKSKRGLKTQSSKKINGFCPSHIKVVEMINGKCTVSFIDTHIGHKRELGPLFPSASGRNLKSAELPFDEIVGNSATASGFERAQILSKKDDNVESWYDERRISEEVNEDDFDENSEQVCEYDSNVSENDEQFKGDGRDGVSEDDVNIFPKLPTKSREYIGHLQLPEAFACPECNKVFKHKRNLKGHFMRMHPLLTFVDQSKPDSGSKYPCKYCGETFNKLYLLKYHFHTKHEDLLHKCMLCGLNLEWSVHLKHLQEKHKILLNTKNLQFTNLQKFLQWKETMEKNMKSSYNNRVRGTSSTVVHGIKHHRYHCQHSGFYEPKVTSETGLKTQDRKNIHGFCPAHIKVAEMTDGKCTVTIIDTHIGHKN